MNALNRSPIKLVFSIAVILIIFLTLGACADQAAPQTTPGPPDLRQGSPSQDASRGMNERDDQGRNERDRELINDQRVSTPLDARSAPVDQSASDLLPTMSDFSADAGERERGAADEGRPDLALDMRSPDLQSPVDMRPVDMQPDMRLVDRELREGAGIREPCERSADCAEPLLCLAWPSGHFCTSRCGVPDQPDCPANYSLSCHVSNSCIPSLCRDGCDPGYICDDSGRCSTP